MQNLQDNRDELRKIVASMNLAIEQGHNVILKIQGYRILKANGFKLGYVDKA